MAERELVAEVVCPRCLKPECWRAGEKMDPLERIFKPEALPLWGPCERPMSYVDEVFVGGVWLPERR